MSLDAVLQDLSPWTSIFPEDEPLQPHRDESAHNALDQIQVLVPQLQPKSFLLLDPHALLQVASFFEILGVLAVSQTYRQLFLAFRKRIQGWNISPFEVVVPLVPFEEVGTLGRGRHNNAVRDACLSSVPVSEALFMSPWAVNCKMQ